MLVATPFLIPSADVPNVAIPSINHGGLHLARYYVSLRNRSTVICPPTFKRGRGDVLSKPTDPFKSSSTSSQVHASQRLFESYSRVTRMSQIYMCDSTILFNHSSRISVE
jgi:hypothetical protein